MSAAFKGEETLKAELRALAAASRQLRQELEDDLALPESENRRPLLHLHSCASTSTTVPRTSESSRSDETAPAKLRLKARELRAQAARKLMKSRSMRERVERAVTRASARNERR
jgi:hypothetical protein